MNYVAHDYQNYATNYIEEHPVSAVFLDMGLGKTVITLTALESMIYDSFQINKVLIIAPLRVARTTWPDEIEKWDHLKGLTYSVAVGTELERIAALCKDVNIHIINRENIQWLVEKSGIPFDYDMIVIDELSSFKSGTSKRFKSLLKVRPKVKRIVGLTGTPSPNSLMDLWAEFRILDMGKRLGRFITHFRQAFFRPEKFNGPVVYSYKPLKGAEEIIYDAISDITISMKGEDYLQLPKCVYNEVPVYLSDEEKEKYKELKKTMVAEIDEDEIDAVNAAALSNKLHQLANGAVYDDEKNVCVFHDHKLDALEDLIEGANGKPVLIAYWFKHDLERMKKRFKVKVLKSSEDIKNWNQGKIPIACIHPASAGHGLNLQAGGSTLIWFGLTWSLELYKQANARLWRQGQKDCVVVHHIITKGTIDERVMKALKEKDDVQESLIKAVKAEMEI